MAKIRIEQKTVASYTPSVTTQVPLLVSRSSSESRLGRLALEGQGEGMEEVDALLVQGGEVGTDGAEGIGAVHGSETAGIFLFDLGHANGLLSKVIGEGDLVVSSNRTCAKRSRIRSTFGSATLSRARSGSSSMLYACAQNMSGTRVVTPKRYYLVFLRMDGNDWPN